MNTHTPYKDTKFCFVPICQNNSRNSQKNFFRVPPSNKQEWCRAVGNESPRHTLHICEDHVNLEEDLENYMFWKVMKARPKLKSRLPQSLMNAPNIQIRHEPKASTSTYMQESVDTQSPRMLHKAVQVKPKIAERSTFCNLNIHKKTPLAEDGDTTIEETLPSTQGSTTSADISEISFESKNLEPIPTKSNILNIIKRKPFSYIGLPKNYFWLIEYLELNLKVKSLNIIMTLYKIRNNTPFYQIADIFEVSLTTLWRTFFKTLCVLSKFFKQLVISPSLLDVKRNLPSSFKTNKEYSNVYCIIDCFEIEIEKPSNPINQSLTWSQYKNANTLKYLISTTPEGFVNFVSAGYGGRISDTSIVENSGFLDVLPPNCTVLADRGFKHIDTILNSKQIKLLRPPSVSKDMKLTKQEAIKSKVIASLRIHVERVIRRVRLFKFLKPHSVINNKLIHDTDDVVIVACGLINLHNAIVNNE